MCFIGTLRIFGHHEDSMKKQWQRSSDPCGKPAIGMIGLGIMGGLMGEVFCQAGFTVLGYDPAIKAQQRFKKSWRPCHISDRAAWAGC